MERPGDRLDGPLHVSRRACLRHASVARAPTRDEVDHLSLARRQAPGMEPPSVDCQCLDKVRRGGNAAATRR
jgi:hypothetical protein